MNKNLCKRISSILSSNPAYPSLSDTQKQFNDIYKKVVIPSLIDSGVLKNYDKSTKNIKIALNSLSSSVKHLPNYSNMLKASQAIVNVATSYIKSSQYSVDNLKVLSDCYSELVKSQFIDSSFPISKSIAIKLQESVITYSKTENIEMDDSYIEVSKNDFDLICENIISLPESTYKEKSPKIVYIRKWIFQILLPLISILLALYSSVQTSNQLSDIQDSFSEHIRLEHQTLREIQDIRSELHNQPGTSQPSPQPDEDSTSQAE